MGDHCVEVEALEDRHHDIDAAGRQTDRVAEAFRLDLVEFLEPAARRRHLGDVGGVFRIVDVEKPDPVDPEGAEALLQRAPHRAGVEAVGAGSRSSLVEITKPGGSPPSSRITWPIRSSLRPAP